MKFISALLFAVVAVAVPAPAPQQNSNPPMFVSTFELYAKSVDPELDGRALSSYADKLGIHSVSADAVQVSFDETELQVLGGIVPAFLGFKAGEDSALHEVLIGAETNVSTTGWTLTRDNSSTSEVKYLVGREGVGRWLAFPFSGEEDGWFTISGDEEREDEVLIQNYIPVDIIAKLVAQS